MEFLPPLLSAIAFPSIDPVLLQIGPLAVHWYGIAYVAGILLAWRYARALVARRDLWRSDDVAITPEHVDDLVLWTTLGVVAGGRLGYVLFYDLPGFVDRPLSAFAIWEGGMSFHGGMLGTMLAVVLFGKSRGLPVWSLVDMAATAAPFGLFFGRLANFINQELYGRPTDLPWGVIFPVAGPEPRHPSQLYEAFLEGLVLFLVIRLMTHVFKKLKNPRFVGGVFIAGYGLIRIAIEFVRLPDAHIGYLAGGWLTMGMVLSIPMVLAGIWAMTTAPRAPEKTSHRAVSHP